MNIRIVCFECFHFSYALARKESKEFTRQSALRNDDKTLKPVYEKALLYFDAKELPNNWDKDDLFGSDSEDDDNDEVTRADDSREIVYLTNNVY